MTDLESLFLNEMRQMYDSENQLINALAELEKYSMSKLLKLAFHHHLKQTYKHVERLKEAFEELGETAHRKPCDGMEGIIDDAQVLVEEFLGNSALDAALIAAAQKVEHYEMIGYQNLCQMAEKLGHKKVASLLEDNLSEERTTDKALTLLAETARNSGAMKHDSAKRSDEEAALLKAITHGP